MSKNIGKTFIFLELKLFAGTSCYSLITEKGIFHENDFVIHGKSKKVGFKLQEKSG